MSDPEIFAAAVKRGDLDAVRNAIDEMAARAEVNDDDTEMRTFFRIAADTPFGSGQ